MKAVVSKSCLAGIIVFEVYLKTTAEKQAGSVKYPFVSGYSWQKLSLSNASLH